MADQPAPSNTTAPLRNVALFTQLVERVMNRPPHLPGLASFHGFSGYGKTRSAIYAANKWRAFYVEAGESWTRAKLCRALLSELGITAKGTVADMTDAIIERLVLVNRPVIIDEFDHLVRKGCHELVRQIHDQSEAPIIVIGEELLPQMLQRSERFHNRMLTWEPAQPSDSADVQQLARLYAPGVQLADDLAELIAKRSDGRVRRICVQIEQIRQEAQIHGWEVVDVATWGDRELFSGQPPARRRG